MINTVKYVMELNYHTNLFHALISQPDAVLQMICRCEKSLFLSLKCGSRSEQQHIVFLNVQHYR